jgi:hypothetical protein
MAFKTEKIGDERIEIEVSQAGKFVATFDETDYRADTYAELIEQLKKAVARYKKGVAVPVTLLGLVPAVKSKWSGPAEKFEKGIGVVHAKLRAEHARNNALLLATDPGGDKFQIGSYESRGVICPRLDENQVATWTTLKTAAVRAETALRAFEEQHTRKASELLAPTLKGQD